MATNDAWLAKVQEVPLEPDLPICDPHHHLWDRREGRVDRRYMLDEILRDVQQSGHNVVSTVFIEHLAMFRADGPDEMKYVGEVEFANGIAAMAASGLYGRTRVAAGIVGYADLMTGSRVAKVLERMMDVSERFRGIRCTGAWDPDPRIARAARAGMYLDAAYRLGASEVARRGLVLDMTARFPQLPECTDFAKALPGLTVVLNHCGGVAGIGAYAGRRDEIFSTWRASIAETAKCANVVVKLGGLGMEYCGFGWHERSRPPTSEEMADAIRPYIETLIELFGPDRCMFESNFPVDKVSSSYGIVWNAFKRITSGYSSVEKAKLYHDTAARVYRLR